MLAAASEWLNGDEICEELYGLHPAAFDRLETFHWEWMADGDDFYRRFVRQMGKPISVEKGVSTAGLAAAAEEVARVVQRRLHARSSPLLMAEASVLWHARRRYLNALIYLRDTRLAKEVEAKAAPDNRPLAICLGSNKPGDVRTIRGPVLMHGYVGCLSTFPDLPFGRGRRWPRLCPQCEPRRSNDKRRAISELQRRVARSERLGHDPHDVQNGRPVVPEQRDENPVCRKSLDRRHTTRKMLEKAPNCAGVRDRGGASPSFERDQIDVATASDGEVRAHAHPQPLDARRPNGVEHP